MRKKLAIKNLMEIKEVFDKLGIEYWLDWGTLLGAVRDGKIIDWDLDIDLGTMYDKAHAHKSVIPELERRGFYVQFEDDFQHLYLVRSGCLVGIHLYRVKGKYALVTTMWSPTIDWFFGVLQDLLLLNEAFVCGTRAHKFTPFVKVLKSCLSLLPSESKKSLFDRVQLVWKQIRRSDKFIQIVVPGHYFEKLDTMKFYGMTFNIPSDVESYLKYHYGKDWRIPKRRWNLSKDDGAVRILKRD